MEYMLKCNAMRCRRELSQRALVTTCSHIFCTDCAGRLGLVNPGGGHEHRSSCPACSSPLTNPDDAVVTDLNPSEDYKTSVLSGLSPNVIFECASRAMSFWAYQATQEVAYQEHLGKTLTEKYTSLSVYLDKTVTEANTQTENLNNKLSGLQPKVKQRELALTHLALDLDLQNMRRKNDELAQALKDKNKKLLQTQELYDKLKRKAMMGQMQYAAEDAADSSLQAAIGIAGEGHYGHDSSSGTAPDIGRGLDLPYQYFHRPPDDAPRGSHINPAPAFNPPLYGTWTKAGGNKTGIPVTPSTHRQRVGEAAAFGIQAIPGGLLATRSPRPSFGDNQSNLRGNRKFPTVGLTSGLKVSHAGGSFTDFSGPPTRPQVSRSAVLTPKVTSGHTGYQPGSIPGAVHSSLADSTHGGFASR